MKALSIRQPWAELILRGLRNEHRTTRTKVRERVYIYACKAIGASLKEMDEINQAFGTDLNLKILPRGVLVGTVEIIECKELGYERYEWVMSGPMRIEPYLKPSGFPQPSFFNPFRITKGGSLTTPSIMLTTAAATQTVRKRKTP